MLKSENDLIMNNLLTETTTQKKDQKNVTSRTQDMVNKSVLSWHKTEVVDTRNQIRLTYYSVDMLRMLTDYQKYTKIKFHYDQTLTM